MANNDSEVKIHIETEADLRDGEEALRMQEKLKKEEDKTSKPKAPTPKAAEPAPKPKVEPKPAEPASKPKVEPKPAPDRPSDTGQNAKAEPGANATKSGAPDAAGTTSTNAAKDRAEAEKSATRQMGEQKDRIGDLQKRIADLHRAAEAYDRKPGMETAAESARNDARKLEREVAREKAKIADEEKAAARERAAAEKAVTREAKEREALRKAGIQRAAGIFSSGQDFVSGGDAAGSLSGAMMGAGARSGNPFAIGAAIIAAIGLGIKGLVDREADKDTAQQLGIRERSFNRGYQLNRESGVFGSSGGLVSSALDADQEIAQRRAARGRLEEKAREKWYNPSTWQWFGLRKNEGTREQEVNEAEIEDFERRRAQAIQAAQRKYSAEEGGLELRTLRGRAERSLAGSRDAFVAEMGQEWLAKYKDVLRSSGSADMAKEMADLTTENRLRDRQTQAGAGLVDSRSGGAEIAAAARWAGGALPGMNEVSEQIKLLHATVQSQANPIRDQAK